MDAVPEQRRRHTYIAVSFYPILVAWSLLQDQYFADTSVGERYNPELFSSGYITLRAADLYVTTGWNLVLFMGGMVYAGIREPRSYVVLKSSIFVDAIESGAAVGRGLQGVLPELHRTNSIVMTTFNPLIASKDQDRACPPQSHEARV